jgi:hypothetical protein
VDYLLAAAVVAAQVQAVRVLRLVELAAVAVVERQLLVLELHFFILLVAQAILVLVGLAVALGVNKTLVVLPKVEMVFILLAAVLVQPLIAVARQMPLVQPVVTMTADLQAELLVVIMVTG